LKIDSTKSTSSLDNVQTTRIRTALSQQIKKNLFQMNQYDCVKNASKRFERVKTFKKVLTTEENVSF